MATRTYSLTAITNADSCPRTASRATTTVTINTVPARPATPTGNNPVCQGSSQTYSVPVDPGATSYTWNLPAGWTGTSTTNSITYTIGLNPGTISVSCK